MTFRSIALPFLVLSFVHAAAADEMHQPSGSETLPLNWSGFYAGIHGGFGKSSTQWGFPFVEYYNTEPGQSFSIDPKGSFVGGHLMLNRQFGRVVMGVEGAYSNATMRADRLGPVTAAFPEDRFKTSIDNIATISARLGYAFDKWLLYAKGGYASADVAHHALSGPPGEGVEATIEAREGGPTVGAGAEYMITPTIILGLEYQFVKLDTERHSTATTGALVGIPINIDSDDIALHAVTARLSIKLGADNHHLENLK